MADDEGEVPPRPYSRGPRVVTGDMKGGPRRPRVVTGPGVAAPDPEPEAVTPPPDDDETTTATLVGPGSPPLPPGEPRRPRVVTGRPPPPPPPPSRAPAPPPPTGPEPSWGPPRWAEPDLPTEPTSSIPPPVHRSASTTSSTPPPPPSAPGKPAKAPRAAGTGSGGSRESLAATALVLALASLVLLGIPAIPALVAAGRAKRRIAGRPGATGGGLVTVARVVAVVALAGWLTVAGIVVANLVRPDGVDYAKLRAGDCIDTPEGTEVRRLTVRPCDEPHDAEVFALVTHPAAPGDAFPGATALLEFAANACLGQPFTDYVGIARGQSTLTEFEIVPESEAWHEGRRGLVCAVDNPDRSPLTSSVRGSAR
jgi:hypothetical protein